MQQDRMQTDLGSKLNLASQIIDNKLPFVDSSKGILTLKQMKINPENSRQHWVERFKRSEL
jgi:hypothetical protein